MRKVIIMINLFIINTFLSTTRFFHVKYLLLRMSGVKIHRTSKVVGPIFMGSCIKLEIGENCWIGRGLSIYGNGSVNIGNNCDVAPDIVILTGSHEIGSEIRRAGKGVSYNITIGDGTWICARSTITGNTTIGKSSIVAACSFVNKDVPSNILVGGSPVKIIKKLR